MDNMSSDSKVIERVDSLVVRLTNAGWSHHREAAGWRMPQFGCGLFVVWLVRTRENLAQSIDGDTRWATCWYPTLLAADPALKGSVTYRVLQAAAFLDHVSLLKLSAAQQSSKTRGQLSAR
jgi:hypothetical protein